LLYVFITISDEDLVDESVKGYVLGLIETHKYVLNVCIVRNTRAYQVTVLPVSSSIFVIPSWIRIQYVLKGSTHEPIEMRGNVLGVRRVHAIRFIKEYSIDEIVFV
jgi:hypothetical protein